MNGRKTPINLLTFVFFFLPRVLLVSVLFVFFLLLPPVLLVIFLFRLQLPMVANCWLECAEL